MGWECALGTSGSLELLESKFYVDFLPLELDLDLVLWLYLQLLDCSHRQVGLIPFRLLKTWCIALLRLSNLF